MIGPDTALAGRYRLLSRLGTGGHGEVWRARDTLLDRVVAVKMVRAGLDGDPEFAARFHAEARSMATVDHPGVVGVFDYGIAEMPGRRTPYLVMQYLDGEPLHLLLSRRGRVPAGTTMDLVAQAADALQAAHEAGVVHRDVKPGNLMIRPDGTVVLTDFGIARTARGQSLTATGIVLGTATYCAPEQAEGAAPSPAMDVYALGVVAYECLVGRPPFDGENAVAIALKHLHELPPPLPDDVPEAVARVVMRALAKDPGERWPTAAALAAAARALADGRVVEGAASDAAPDGAWERQDAGALAPGGIASFTEGGRPLAESPEGRATHAGGDTATRAPTDRAAGRSSSGDRAAGGTQGSGSRRTGRRALAVGGGFAAVVIAGAATSWALMQNEVPPPTTFQAGTDATAEPSLQPMTNTEDAEARDKDDIPEPTANPAKTAEPDPAEKAGKPTDSQEPSPAATTGILIGGIILLGGPSPGLTAADGYQPGLVEVYSDQGKRVASKRTDKSGFRFSLPEGGYRVQVGLGAAKCSVKAEVMPGRTTRADLKCSIPTPPPDPAFQTAAIKDARGDLKDRPDAGKAPPYADLLGAATRAGGEGVTLDFLTAGALPIDVPAPGDSRRHWAASFQQGGRTAILSINGAKGAWTVRWAAKDPKTGLAVATDQVTVAAKPVISGPRISAALGRSAPLKTAPIDFTKPYRIVAAESNVVDGRYGWVDRAP